MWCHHELQIFALVNISCNSVLFMIYDVTVATLILVLVLESQHKSSTVSSIRSLVVGEERMRPGRCLGSVLCVTFSVLTLMVGWQEGHLDRKNVCHSCLQKLNVQAALSDFQMKLIGNSDNCDWPWRSLAYCKPFLVGLFVQLCIRWHYFDWHSTSHGYSVR